MEKSAEIYGIRAVIEAINSKKDIDKVFIQTGLKGKLIGQLESLIRKNKINFSYVPTQKLDRLSKKNHQGVIARISPIKFFDINEFSEIIEKSKIFTIVSFHPAYLLRQPDQKKFSWEDLKKIRDKIKNLNIKIE